MNACHAFDTERERIFVGNRLGERRLIAAA
jgi:hypothetical protein